MSLAGNGPAYGAAEERERRLRELEAEAERLRQSITAPQTVPGPGGVPVPAPVGPDGQPVAPAPGTPGAPSSMDMQVLQQQLEIAQLNNNSMENIANMQMQMAQQNMAANVQNTRTSTIGMIIGAALGAHTTSEVKKQWLPHESGAATIKSWELAQKWGTTMNMKQQGYQDVAINFALNNKDGRAKWRDPQWNSMKMAEDLKKDTLTNLQMFGVKSDKNPHGVAMSPEEYIDLMSYKPADSIMQVDPKVAEQRNQMFEKWEKEMRGKGMGMIVDMYKNPQLSGTSVLSMGGPEPLIDPTIAPLLQMLAGGDPTANAAINASSGVGGDPTMGGVQGTTTEGIPGMDGQKMTMYMDKPMSREAWEKASKLSDSFIKPGSNIKPLNMSYERYLELWQENHDRITGGTDTPLPHIDQQQQQEQGNSGVNEWKPVGNFDPSKPVQTYDGYKFNVTPKQQEQMRDLQAQQEKERREFDTAWAGRQNTPEYEDARRILGENQGSKQRDLLADWLEAAQQITDQNKIKEEQKKEADAENARMNEAWQSVLNPELTPKQKEINKLKEMGVIDKYGMVNAGVLMSFVPPELTAPPEFNPKREIGDKEKAMMMDEYNKYASMPIDPKNIVSENLGQGVTRKTLKNADGTIAGSMMEGYMQNAMGESIFVSMSGTRLQNWYDKMTQINGLGPLFPGIMAPVTDSELNGTFEPGFWDSQPGAATYKPITPEGMNSPTQMDKRMTAPGTPSGPNDKTKGPNATSTLPSGYVGVPLAAGG